MHRVDINGISLPTEVAMSCVQGYNSFSIASRIARILQFVQPLLSQSSFLQVRAPHLIRLWPATAVAGNDVTSSCLYTVGLVGAVAGTCAPLCLLLVGVMLYSFRGVYSEVCTAIPLNGGAYNALLHTTSKV